MKKAAIIAIVGASGSGKTSLSLWMQEEKKLPALCSYTTRSKRKGETHGKEHYFVNKQAMPDQHNILAQTKFGEHYYWTDKRDVFEIGRCSYVIDEYGLLELKAKHSEVFDIYSVLIKRNEDKRAEIDEKRKKRDEERLVLRDDYYDVIIDNNGDNEQAFFNEAWEKIQSIINE